MYRLWLVNDQGHYFQPTVAENIPKIDFIAIYTSIWCYTKILSQRLTIQKCLKVMGQSEILASPDFDCGSRSTYNPCICEHE